MKKIKEFMTDARALDADMDLALERAKIVEFFSDDSKSHLDDRPALKIVASEQPIEIRATQADRLTTFYVHENMLGSDGRSKYPRKLT